mmetsp:Transcript_37922/g.72672  ORF Transcript_37922/g.72672 Transcript_37922/m.72672 type:complete len:370 (-) Transcript_37922:427-1536(-)
MSTSKARSQSSPGLMPAASPALLGFCASARLFLSLSCMTLSTTLLILDFFGLAATWAGAVFARSAISARNAARSGMPVTFFSISSGTGSSAWFLCRSLRAFSKARFVRGSSRSNMAMLASACFLRFSAPADLSIMSTVGVGISDRFFLSSARRRSKGASCAVTGRRVSIRPSSSSMASRHSRVAPLELTALHVLRHEGAAATSSQVLVNKLLDCFTYSGKFSLLISLRRDSSLLSCSMTWSEIHPGSPSSGICGLLGELSFVSLHVTLKVLIIVSRMLARLSHVAHSSEAAAASFRLDSTHSWSSPGEIWSCKMNCSTSRSRRAAVDPVGSMCRASYKGRRLWSSFLRSAANALSSLSCFLAWRARNMF